MRIFFPYTDRLKITSCACVIYSSTCTWKSPLCLTYARTVLTQTKTHGLLCCNIPSLSAQFHPSFTGTYTHTRAQINWHEHTKSPTNPYPVKTVRPPQIDTHTHTHTHTHTQLPTHTHTQTHTHRHTHARTDTHTHQGSLQGTGKRVVEGFGTTVELQMFLII